MKALSKTCTNCNKATRPTAMTESHLITAVIDAEQGTDVITANILNAFVQINIDTNSMTNNYEN